MKSKCPRWFVASEFVHLTVRVFFFFRRRWTGSGDYRSRRGAGRMKRQSDSGLVTRALTPGRNDAAADSSSGAADRDGRRVGEDAGKVDGAGQRDDLVDVGNGQGLGKPGAAGGSRRHRWRVNRLEGGYDI